jgi:hypothetical protein
VVNLRYHIVSLVAVFLALGIGVVMGSTVIDRATIDVLERQQEQLRASIQDVQARNAELLDELERAQRQDAALAEEVAVLVADRLLGVPVVVLTLWTADDDVVDDLKATIVAAGADLRGTVRVTDRFVLDDEGERRDLALVLGIEGTLAPEALRVRGIDAVVGSLAGAVDPAGDTLLDELVDGGFLEVDQPSAAEGQLLIGSGVRALLVAGPPDADADAATDPALDAGMSLATEITVDGRGLVVAQPAAPEATEDAWDGSLVGRVRAGAVPGEHTTIDDVDLVTGRLAAVYALVDLGGGRTGHYGSGPGADRRLPPPT